MDDSRWRQKAEELREDVARLERLVANLTIERDQAIRERDELRSVLERFKVENYELWLDNRMIREQCQKLANVPQEPRKVFWTPDRRPDDPQ